jgi:hypothetical protein
MGSPDLAVWILVLVVQTIPYLAAIALSLLSALPLPARLVGVPAVAGAVEPPAVVEPELALGEDEAGR